MNNNQNFKSQPANQNIAQPTRFQMNFARLPHTTFWCQSVVLPGMNASYATSPTPFVDQKLPGDKAVYEPLIVSMLLDEDLQGWREVQKWIEGFTFPKEFKQYRDLKNLSDALKSIPKPQYSDINLTVYNSNWQPILKFTYVDAFPTSLGALNYSSSDSPDSIMTTDVTFEYQYFDVTPVKSVA